MSVETTAQASEAGPILVTGAAGAVGSIGRNLAQMLLAKGHKVRGLVRREDERAEALRQLGAEVMRERSDRSHRDAPRDRRVRADLFRHVGAAD